MLKRPFRVGLLCSRRAPGLAALAAKSREGLFEIACCLSSEEDFAERKIARESGIPVLVHPLRAFHRRRRAPLHDWAVRAEYDAETARRLAPFGLDALVLSSYLYVLTEPMLSAFPDRIFSVHGADLTQTGRDGLPLYVGLRAVRDAIVAGELQTRACVHLVTEALDEGPVLLRSWPFAVSPLAADAREAGDRKALHAYAFAHQEWMLRRAWGSLLAETIHLLAGTPVRLDGNLFRLGPICSPWDVAEEGGIEWDAEPPATLRLAGRAG
jgi:folate-dependent phosphoribosylglycinamide formyltransferase PurN